jgi:hypothetical protein
LPAAESSPKENAIVIASLDKSVRALERRPSTSHPIFWNQDRLRQIKNKIAAQVATDRMLKLTPCM